jgi:tyrosine-protein kinase Etk/Wzc
VGDEEIVVKKDADDPLAEGFRMMRFGLNYVGKDAHVIMFTSTVPGEGKTFVSRNFAVTLSLLGKSVVLIDTDIRKRTQTRLSGIHGHAGLTTYLCGDTDDISTLLVKGDDNFPVDVIPAGVVPPNPAEMLSDERLDQLVAALRKQYDYVILDSVPALAVADAGIVNRVAELTVYVIREGKIDRRYLPELEKMHREDKFNHLCIVVNDSHTDNRKHGYGYGYGYGYGHNHGYGLGYGDKTYARRRFRHILRK